MLAFLGVPVIFPEALPKVNAATINFGGVEGSVSAQQAYTGATYNADGTATFDTPVGGGCLKYGTITGTTVSASAAGTWVSYPDGALGSHGYGGSTCPAGATPIISGNAAQSTVQVTPADVSSVTDGTPFLLGRVVHYNNPISGVYPKYYAGDLNVRFSGFAAPNTVTFNWQLAETTNNPGAGVACERSPKELNPQTNGTGINSNGCADWISFTSQVPTTTLTKDGITYKLVVNGFDQSPLGCPDSLDPGTGAAQTFWTTEQATTSACLYASFQQVRSLEIKKVVQAPSGVTPPATTFDFASTSTLTGSAWDADTWTLADGASRGPLELLQGDTVTVTETPKGGKWALSSIACVDGAGATVPVTTDLAAGTMTLANVAAPATLAAGPITCTYTNTYTPNATLTLAKTLTGAPAGVSATDWTLTASNGTQTISGATGTAAVTAQTVPVGTYTLSETGPTGYAATWACVDDTGAAVTVTNNQVALADSANVTCTANNRYQTGKLAITKTVSGPTGGFTGGTAKVFSGSYACGTITGNFTVENGGTFTAPENIPAGTSCTVTETAPTGSANLANTSYVWTNVGYAPAQSVTIADNQTATVGITNTYVQNKGSLVINKAIAPRDGTPATGYTGGVARTFGVHYACTLGGATVAEGDTAISTGTAATINDIPATASCTVTETAPTTASGDFVDASYGWDGNAISAAAVVPVNGQAAVTVTNYFKKYSASLVVAKTIQGAGYTGGTAENFTVTVTCGTDTPQVVTVANGSSKTLTVPANLGCTVIETQPAGNLQAAYEWGAPTYSGLTNGTVAVAPGASSTVTVTNHTVPIFGKVSVVKALTGETTGVVANSVFPVRVNCGAAYDQVLNLVAGTPQVTPDLPVGTSCTVTEQSQPALLDASYAWDAIPAAQTVTVDTKDQTVDVTVTNNVKRVYGSLAITKAVTAKNGVDGASTAFSGTWTCTYGTTDYTGTWSRTGGGAATLTGPATAIPLTAVCSATENTLPAGPSSDPSYYWGAPTITGPVTLTAAAPNVSLSVTNPVLRSFGAFTVSKTVNGGAAGTAFVDDEFTFSYTCAPQSGDAITGTLAAKAGQSASLPSSVQIPAGSTCVVTETGKASALNPYTWDSTSYTVGTANSSSNATFTVAADGTTAVSVINTLSAKEAAVTVTKAVTGSTAGLVAGTTFTVNVMCTVPGGTAEQPFGPVQIADGASASVNVPLGSTCRAVEVAPTGGLVDGSYAWDTATYSPVTAPVTANGASFTVTNPIKRVYNNDLKIAKAVTDPDAVTDPTKTFSGTWQCTYGTDTPVTGTWTINGAGEATVSGVPTEGILIGSACTVTETALTGSAAANGDPSYTWAAPQYGNASVEVGATTRLTVTNAVQRATGSFTITKQIAGETAGYIGTGTPFVIDYSCRYGNVDHVGQVTLAAGGSATATGIPLGWTCSAAENSAPGAALLANASYSWGAPTVSDPVVVTAAAVPTVTVTNPIIRNHGSLTITKAIGANADAVSSSATFSGAYSCSYAEGTTTTAYTGTWTVTGAGNATLTADAGQPAPNQIPVTSTCSVTENAPSGGLVDASWAWSSPTIGAAQTIEQTGQQANVTVTNTPQRVYGTLSVEKAFSGDATKALKPGAVVSGTWSCTVAGGTRPEDNQQGTWQAPAAGGTVVLFTADGTVKVPLTATCTVVETTPDAALLTDGSYAWKLPTYSPAGGTVELTVDGPKVTITNSVERVYGSLEITKVIDVPANVTIGDLGLTFTGAYNCTHAGDDPQTGTWTLAYPGKATIDNILVGSVCSLTENPAAGSASSVDPSWVFDGTNTITPSQATVFAGQPVGVTVTNHTKRLLTGIVFTKVLTGGELPATTVFSVRYACTDLSGGTHSGSGTVAAGATWASPVDIPIGSHCVVSEGDLPNVGPRYTWAPVSYGVTSATNVTSGDGTVAFDIPTGEQVEVARVNVNNHLLRQEAGYIVNKTASPLSGSTVRPGDTITYTLTVTPTGPGVTDNVVVTDNLSQVLPFAELTLGTASQGATNLSGNTLTWNVGTLSGTAPQTLTYTAKVKDGMWGVDLKNLVTATGEKPPTECPTCTTTTEHHTPIMWTLTKGADPISGSTVRPGDVITYQLTLRNVSMKSLENIVVTDDLSQVLNNASYIGTPLPDPAVTLSGTTLTWTVPTLLDGATVTLNYQVKVSNEAWGATLRNVVVGTRDGAPPPECPECVTTTTHKVPPKDRPLPRTGTQSDAMMLGMAVLIGLTLMGAHRRRTR